MARTVRVPPARSPAAAQHAGDAARSLPPEVQLLFLTGADGVPGEEMEALLGVGPDWTKVIPLLMQQRALPVLWRQVQGARSAVIPVDARSAIRRMARVSEFRASYMEQRLHQSVAALASAGVDVVLLKGAALATTVYPAFAARPMGDIDLLVRSEQLSRAVDVLRGNGWNWQQGRTATDVTHDHHHAAPLFDARGLDIAIELHTQLFYPGHPFRFGPEEIRDSAVRVPHHGGNALVPSPVYSLVYASIHFAWAHMMRAGAWRTLADVRALTRGGFDWDEFIDVAQRSRGASCCYWTLRLARALSRVDVPARVLDVLRPSLSRYVLDLLERHYAFVMLPMEGHCPSARARRVLWELGVQPGRSGHGNIRPWGVGRGMFRRDVPDGDDEPRVTPPTSRYESALGMLQHVARLLTPNGRERRSVSGLRVV